MGVVGLKSKHVCVPCLGFSNRKVILLEAVICDTQILFLYFYFVLKLNVINSGIFMLHFFLTHETKFS